MNIKEKIQYLSTIGRILTRSEAANIARVTPQTISNWVRYDGLQSGYAGSQLRILESDLLEFLFYSKDLYSVTIPNGATHA